MKNRPEEELKQIAVDLFQGKIFTDRHLQRLEDLPMVFMVIAFMRPKDLEKLKDDPPGLIFEYLDKAAPRGTNGMPGFFSCQMLSQEDTKKVSEICGRLEKAQKEVLESS